MAKTLYIIDGHAHIYADYFAPMRQLNRHSWPIGLVFLVDFAPKARCLAVHSNYELIGFFSFDEA